MVSAFCECVERLWICRIAAGRSFWISSALNAFSSTHPHHERNVKEGFRDRHGHQLTQLEQQHALSIAVFSNYLILDTILCAIPRFLVLGLLQNLSHTLCSSPPSSPFSPPPDTQSHIPSSPTELHAYSPNSPASQWERVTGSWTPDGCYRIVYLTQMALAAGVIAGTLLQFVGALCVREYARALWVRDLRDEALLTRSAERGEAPLSEKQAQIKN